MKRFEKVTEPVGLEFFSIEDDGRGGKDIHVWGYLYSNGEDEGDGEWRNVEYTGFLMPLEDFIMHYDYEDGYVDHTAGELQQYIGDMTDGEAVDAINGYFGGQPADYELNYSELRTDTPAGNYCFRT